MPDLRMLWKQIFPTVGFYRETVKRYGSVSGTITVPVADGMNHHMTVTGASTVNVTATGQPAGTIGHILLHITMSAANAVIWQLNGVTQTGVSISLNASGQSEVLIRSWDDWGTYVATRVR